MYGKDICITERKIWKYDGDTSYFQTALEQVFDRTDLRERNAQIEKLALMTKWMEAEEIKKLFAEEAAQKVMKDNGGFWVGQAVCSRRDRRRLNPDLVYWA